ncbi:MAG: hypothetical protein ACREBQ_04100 [Nitrososphaerales archaeon]
MNKAVDSKNRLISISLEEVGIFKEGKLDVEGLRSAAGQIARLVKRGFRIIIVVGGGSLGEEYSRIAIKFSKGRQKSEVKRRAAEANSFLLIAAMRNLGVAVNSDPVTDMRRVEDFLSNSSWSVAVIANQEEERRSSIVASQLSKKYHMALIHVATTKEAIDRAI